MTNGNRWILSLALLSASAATAQVEVEQRPVQAYEGAAAIGNLDRVTVVYPQADGEVGLRHRASARLRASYLRERYGVVAEVAADDATTEEQLRGHLLLLGWDNRLLGNDRVARPFQRDSDGFKFLGIPGGPEDDLLWMHVSPYNSEKYLAFWSRMDPELDRFLAFPFIGSDYAVYRDYFVLRQGMFAPSGTWPPTRNPEAEHEEPFYEPPVTQASAHYQLRAAGPAAVAQAAAILAAREAALERAVALSGLPAGDRFRVELFVYPDRETKDRLTGVADPVHSVPPRRALFMTLDRALVRNPHEELHLLAAHAYGPCPLTALYEGLVFVLTERDRRNALDAYAALAVQRGIEVALGDILDDERLRRQAQAGLGLAPAGWLVDWIESSGGRSLVRELYGMNGEQVLQRLAVALGPGAPPAERFRDWLAERARAGAEESRFRAALAHARQRAAAGDLFGRAQALSEALAIRPDDAEVAYQLALSWFEVGQPDEARPVFERLAQSTTAGSSYVPAFARYQLGRIREGAGETAEAARLYREVLALPDVHDSHRLATEALARLAPGSS